MVCFLLYSSSQASTVNSSLTFDIDVAGGYISIAPNASDTIKLKSRDIGVGIASEIKGTRIKLRCTSTNEWQVIEEIGMWVIAGYKQSRFTNMYNTTAPTTGAWIATDNVINSAPTIAKNISKWVCVTSGTPGVWIAQGTGTGTTAQSPTLVANDQCYSYYDTTLAKMILWNGTTWLV